MGCSVQCFMFHSLVFRGHDLALMMLRMAGIGLGFTVSIQVMAGHGVESFKPGCLRETGEP
jgi:hypothetical protein